MSKILCLSHIFPPAIDGGSRVVYKLGQYFQNQGNQVLFLSSDCSSTDDFTKKVSLFKGKTGLSGKGFIKIPVYHHLRRFLKFINLFIPPKTYLHQLLKVFQKGPIFKFIPFIKTTFKIIKFKPDLIIAGPLPTTIILYANFLKKISTIYNLRPKILLNASFHPTDHDFHCLPLIKTLQKADYLWTLTQFETNYFIKNFNINPKKIILAGNGIDQSFLKTNKQKKVVPCPVKGRGREGFRLLFIGSLSAHKGLDTLITSFSNIYRPKSNISLTIAGQKTLYYPQIKKQIQTLPQNIKSKIKFIFNFSQNKLSQIIDNCDILILPSKQESFGLVIIEAWARQKPVIVSDIPSLSEITQKANGGLTFKLNNFSNLNQKISKLLKNSKLANQLGKNGFNYVKNNYTWNIVGRKIKEEISLY